MKTLVVRCRRRALSLTEVLVVIAILGVLAALILCAVQASREMARRTHCQNNLRQIALAVDSFESAHGIFPPGQFGGAFGVGENSRAWSFLARLLPYIEENSRAEAAQVPSAMLAQSNIVQDRIPLLLCPSAPSENHRARLDAGNLIGFLVGPTSYKGVSGANWGDDSSRGGNFPTPWRNVGANGSFDGLAAGDGLLFRSDSNLGLNKSQVHDGLSNTFLLGEDLGARNHWCSWPYSNNAYGTCAIPPNHDPSSPNDWTDSWSFRSAHRGGLQFSMADGSVRFVSASIELSVYRALATRSGGELVVAP